MNGNSISLLSYLHSTHSCSQQSSRRFGLILLGLLVVGWYFDWFLRINFGLLHQHGYGGANDNLGVRIRVGDDRSKLMFVDLGWYGLIWVAHGGRARGLIGLQWQSSWIVWVTGCSGRTCGFARDQVTDC